MASLLQRVSAILVGTCLCLAPSSGAFAQQPAAPAQGRTPARPPAAAQPSQPQTPPCPIVADPPGADFGVVDPGTVVASTIKLINPFDRPVRIVEAKPSCTCTTVDMKGKVIPAKGFLEMPMSMKTAHSVGKKGAQVTLVFEGVSVPLVVKLDAETAYAVRANPPHIDALDPARMRGFFELISGDGQPFTVKTVDGKPAQTADGSVMKPAVRQVVKYDLTTPGLNPNGVPPFLIVETDHPKCPVLDLRVRHETTRISPVLSFAEFRENLGVVTNGTPAPFEVQIKHAGATRVDRVAAQHKEWQATLGEQVSDGDGLLVKAALLPVGVAKGPFLFRCQFGAGSKTSDLWIYGVCR
jgi:hypothetical protein